MVVVWAHMGLSYELQTLHPLVHSHIMKQLFQRHPNLYADLSWDIVAKLLLRNYNQQQSEVRAINANFSSISDLSFGEKLERNMQLGERIKEIKQNVVSPNISSTTRTEEEESTLAIVLYLDMFEEHKDR